MFLRTEFALQEAGGGGQAPAPRPEAPAHDLPDVAAILYVSGGVLVRVMMGDGLN